MNIVVKEVNQNIKCVKQNNIVSVYIRTVPNTTDWTTIGTIPQEYVPKDIIYNSLFFLQTSNTYANCVILTDGTIQCINNTGEIIQGCVTYICEND